MKAEKKKVQVALRGEAKLSDTVFDRVLVAIGRRPNSENLGLETTKVERNEQGYIIVDEQRRTADPHIFAIGDVAGGMLLAHEAMSEGKVAAEVIAGHPATFGARAIPAVVYTDPQIAWCGLTEQEAHAQGREVKVARFPWKASGRAVSMGAADGFTKVIIDPESQRVLGVGIVGRHAEALVAEGVLAVEMGAVAQDLALTIHPHPTLSETIGEAAELLLGGATRFRPCGCLRTKSATSCGISKPQSADPTACCTISPLLMSVTGGSGQANPRAILQSFISSSLSTGTPISASKSRSRTNPHLYKQ